ncbi:MAG: adenylate/guanylate cyclase domain-containing protein [Planctomycetales bacterium]|nr:adenylate/guanylate cyclase domain-containing protein [Planctomycetales bacterium]
MNELSAKGEQDGQFWKYKLPEGGRFTLGRNSVQWNVPWEPWLSREHAVLEWNRGKLKVHKVHDAKNPIFFRGKEADTFAVKPGENFVIGATVFTLEVANEQSVSTGDGREVLHAFTVSRQDLQHVPFRDAPHRLDVLGHLAQVIQSATNETDFQEQAVNLLLEGIRKADVACLVELDPKDESLPLRVLSTVDRANSSAFRPSGRLVRKAVRLEQQSVVHVWTSEQQEADEAFTLMGNFDWSFCTPLHGPAGNGMAIYIAGRLAGASPANALAPWRSNDLTEDVKFAELVAAILSALRQNRYLQHRQSVLSHFFSPSVLRIVAASDPETALKPRDAEVTVLFCDLRGFSRKVEKEAGHLSEILQRVSAALGIMTKCILDRRGVVADFLGDCAMAFWGWPLSNEEDVQQACLAALDIQSAFHEIANDPNHPLADFRVGVGLATGLAVAGQIGSKDQAKVTVFGPVVNLASRLEGLTKILRVPILIDETTAKYVKTHMGAEKARCRRLARVQPYGLDGALDVSELLLPVDSNSVLNDEHLIQYEAALQAFLNGDWTKAYEFLHAIPPQDLGKDLITSYILQHNHSPPTNWDGVIPMQSKN